MLYNKQMDKVFCIGRFPSKNGKMKVGWNLIPSWNCQFHENYFLSSSFWFAEIKSLQDDDMKSSKEK